MRAAALPFAVVLALLAGCGEGGTPIVPKAPPPSAESAYLAAPSVTAAEPGREALILSGAAPAGARVRLATPAGEALFAEADDQGRWRLALPAGDEARIFGLSAFSGGRTAQAEGYLLVTGAGEAVMLRAGAGAVRIGREGRAQVDAVDFDREGGAVISGRAPAGATLSIHVDGDQVVDGRADAAGRYAIPLPQPITGASHLIDVFGDAAENPVTIDARPAAPISDGPFRIAPVSGGLRIDWLTPGGGVQSTLLLE
ncbi:MAG: hypothetical protein ACK41C_13680 [Phenylobacterium sp.]|uniref:hypothetical protein n=1 Tax=Phenylobacterium sp. TaxID=1871053 RepID=UPI00391D43CD